MVDCSGFIQPLNLQCLLVNVFTGSPESTLFVFICMILIASLAAYFRMPNTITLASFVLFMVIMSSYVERGIYSLIILTVSLVVYYTLIKVFKS